jgi:acetyltransferase-like isoleucine patch superfamily enzyme
MTITAKQITLAIPGAVLIGDADAQVTEVVALHNATPGSLSWLRPGRDLPDGWPGSVLIAGPCLDSHTIDREDTWAIVLCRNPRIGLGRVLTKFFQREIGSSGIRSWGGGGYAHSTAVIGMVGNSVEWDDEAGQWFRIPSVARVVIGNDVRIGAYTTVVRGVLEDTVIGDGSEICNHVNIGHGAKIGKHCLIAPFSAIGGSSTIGERVTIWQHAAIRNGVRVGPGAVIGQGANVVCDVPEGETWVGNPARKR